MRVPYLLNNAWALFTLSGCPLKNWRNCSTWACSTVNPPAGAPSAGAGAEGAAPPNKPPVPPLAPNPSPVLGRLEAAIADPKMLRAELAPAGAAPNGDRVDDGASAPAPGAGPVAGPAAGNRRLWVKGAVFPLYSGLASNDSQIRVPYFSKNCPALFVFLALYWA